ncbi:MAG: hypothetical protein IJT59_07860 [Desulfovibrionaceae bacterium]|nr:hypothetical protein [Desulfovibrionaceae bacterium]
MGKRPAFGAKSSTLYYLREGHGSGNLADYRPWIHTGNFSSYGEVTRINDIILAGFISSCLALSYFAFILRKTHEHLDIREQYLLPLYDYTAH